MMTRTLYTISTNNIFRSDIRLQLLKQNGRSRQEDTELFDSSGLEIPKAMMKRRSVMNEIGEV